MSNKKEYQKEYRLKNKDKAREYTRKWRLKNKARAQVMNNIPKISDIPKISVVITCYNYGKFIDEAIESVQNQTFRDYEIILIDDCSTDEFTKDKIKVLQTGIYPPFYAKVIARSM